MTATLLLTRPESSSLRFLSEVEEAIGQRVRAVVSPMIAIVPMLMVWDGGPVKGVVLSSEFGAQTAGQMGFPAGLTAFCVGDRTAQAAEAAGFAAVSASGDADDLVRLILDQRMEGPLVHLRGEHARGNIALRLNEAGVPCAERVVYAQTKAALSPEALALLSGPNPVVAPLFSPRTVTIFQGQGPFHACLHVIAISDAVAKAADSLKIATLDLAARPDGPSMVAATVNRLRGLSVGPSA
ncbi:MAG: uroporphyrinogen-III synthase [Rhodobacterales bacterium]|nr:uroporphyrinogen-III synthase [Rhodobacterales bacterium]